MSPSEIKLKRAELCRVQGQRLEQEAAIDKLRENIERLEKSVTASLAAEAKLEKEIAEAQSAKA